MLLTRRLCATLGSVVFLTLAACSQVDEPPSSSPPPSLTPQSLPTSVALPVTNVAVTADGAVWYSFGSYSFHPVGGGVAQLFEGTVTRFGEEDGLPGDSVQRLEVSPDGTLWAAAGCRVGAFDGHSWRIHGQDCHVTGGNILDFAFTNDGAVWMATGLNLVRLYQGSWIQYDRLANFLAVDADGSLWMSGWEGRQGSGYLAIFGEGDWRKMDLSIDVGGRIFDGPDRRIWVEQADGGLVRITNEGWETVYTAEQVPFDRLWSFDFAPDGSMWAMTAGGLAAFDGRAWRVLDDAPRGSAVAAAPDGSLWIGTNQGNVVQYRPG